MNIVICGSRKFNDFKRFKFEMDDILQDKEEVILVSGGAKGADSMAENYADRYGYEFYEIPADWNQHGKKAGMLRNIQMLEIAHMVVAFWDGRSKGTKHMVDQCKKRNIQIQVIDV